MKNNIHKSIWRMDVDFWLPSTLLAYIVQLHKVIEIQKAVGNWIIFNNKLSSWNNWKLHLFMCLEFGRFCRNHLIQLLFKIKLLLRGRKMCINLSRLLFWNPWTFPVHHLHYSAMLDGWNFMMLEMLIQNHPYCIVYTL